MLKRLIKIGLRDAYRGNQDVQKMFIALFYNSCKVVSRFPVLHFQSTQLKTRKRRAPLRTSQSCESDADCRLSTYECYTANVNMMTIRVIYEGYRYPHFLNWGSVSQLFRMKRWRIFCQRRRSAEIKLQRNRFRPGISPGPRLENSRRSPRPPESDRDENTFSLFPPLSSLDQRAPLSPSMAYFNCLTTVLGFNVCSSSRIYPSSFGVLSQLSW